MRSLPVRFLKVSGTDDRFESRFFQAACIADPSRSARASRGRQAKRSGQGPSGSVVGGDAQLFKRFPWDERVRERVTIATSHSL